MWGNVGGGMGKCREGVRKCVGKLERCGGCGKRW